MPGERGQGLRALAVGMHQALAFGVKRVFGRVSRWVQNGNVPSPSENTL